MPFVDTPRRTVATVSEINDVLNDKDLSTKVHLVLSTLLRKIQFLDGELSDIRREESERVTQRIGMGG